MARGAVRIVGHPAGTVCCAITVCVGLGRGDPVLVPMVTEVSSANSLLVCAIRSRSAPGELERQNDEQEEDEQATHGASVSEGAG